MKMVISEKAKQIYNNAIIIDNQLAFEVAMPVSFEEKWKIVDRYKASGVTALTLSLANDEATPETIIFYLAKILNYIKQHSDKYIIAKTAEDILQAKKLNKLALRFMFQGANALNKNIEMLELYHQLGITNMIIAYNVRNAFGDGVIEKNDGGLSLLGHSLVSEMNRVGIIIDVAHTGYKTAIDIIENSNKPVINSHSGIYAIHPHIRNLKDSQIKAIAKSGGIIGITGLGKLLGDDDASLVKFVDHIDYVAKLIGPQYIGIGLDYLYFPDNFDKYMKSQPVTHPVSYSQAGGDATTWKSIQPEQLIELVELLIQRGYSEEDIKGILGKNLLRVISRS